jgi:hypothetical protein
MALFQEAPWRDSAGPLGCAQMNQMVRAKAF